MVNRIDPEMENENMAATYFILKKRWQNGDRDRELGLHLMFLAWYGLIEPGHLTGFTESEELTRELNQTFSAVHDHFEPQIYRDAEMLYVFGLAAYMFWYMFDDADKWKKRATDYQKQYRAIRPNGIDPEIFHGRGAYGEYYAEQSEIEDGY